MLAGRTEDEMMTPNPPFVIGVLADFSGVSPSPLPKFRDRRFVTVTQDSFAHFLSNKKPRLTPTVRSDTVPEGVRKLELTFGSLADFQLDGVARRLQQSNALEPVAAQALSRSLALEEGFQALHGSWAGLKYLVDSLKETPSVKVEVLDVSKRELLRDLQRAVEPCQSSLFHKVFSQAIGTFGGEAFGCLIGDYYFDDRREDAELLQLLSQVVAPAGAPLLSGVRSGIVGVPERNGVGPEFSYADDTAPVKPSWRRNDQWADGWSVFLFLPRVRPRCEVEGPPFESSVQRPDYPWLNPAFIVGKIIADAFSGDSSTEIVRKIFPQWNDAAGLTPLREFEGESRSGSKGVALEFESDFSAQLENRLDELGLNALSESRLAQQDLLQGLVAATPASPELSSPGLAQVLLCCRVWNRLRDYLRTRKSTGSAAQLLETAQAWLDAINFDPLTGRRLLPFEHITVARDGSCASVNLTFLPAVCGQRRTRDLVLSVH